MNTATTPQPTTETATPKVKRTCMYLSVRGGIRMIQGDRSRYTWLNHDDGRPMTKDEGINALMDELAKGHEVIPMNTKCGNPCQNSPQCAGFDYSANGGCPGYEVETPAAVEGAQS
jgi:hypothetical protein